MNERPDPTAEAIEEDDERRARRAALLHVPGPMTEAPAWILTFADLISQLNGLFILMLTFAHFAPTNFQHIAGSVAETFGAKPASSSRVPDVTVPPTEGAPAGAASQATGLLDGLRSLVARHGGRLRGGAVDVEAFEDYRGITLSLGEAALFDGGETAVRPAAWPFLDAIAETIAARSEVVDIEVRVAPDQPPGEGGHRLAARRGLGLLEYLRGRQADLPAERLRLRAVGVAESTGPLGGPVARAAAERVDFVFSRAAEQVQLPP